MDATGPDSEFLAPARVSLSAREPARLRLTLQQDRSYLEVKAVRAFPLSKPDRLIGLLDVRNGDRIIGIIADPRELDASSRKCLMKSVDGHYFLPTITRICSLREEFGAAYFDVETDCGKRHFVAKGLRDGTQHLGDGELLIPDVDGNRYRIPDWRRLDALSRKFLMPVV